MKTRGLDFNRRGPRLVWVLSIAAVTVSLGGLLTVRAVMSRAFKEQEQVLNLRSQQVQSTADLSDLLVSQDDLLSHGLDRTATWTRDTLDQHQVQQLIDEPLKQLPHSSEAARRLADAGEQVYAAIRDHAQHAFRIEGWRRACDEALSEVDEREQAVRSCVQRWRTELVSILGREKLHRLVKVKEFRAAQGETQVSAATEALAAQDSIAHVLPLDRELADVLVTVGELTSADSADEHRDLAANQLAQQLERLGHSIEHAGALFEKSDNINPAGLRELSGLLLGAHGAADGTHQTVTIGSGGLLAAIEKRRSTLTQAEELRATHNRLSRESREAVAHFAQYIDELLQEQVAAVDDRIVSAWGTLGVLTGIASAGMLVLGGLIAGSVRRQVTTLAETNRQLDEAMTKAEAASRAKSDFLANMSHEIRTPMTAILGYTELLLAPDQTAEERGEHIRTVRRNGEHLMGIINDILDISKIEAGHMRLEDVEASPAQLVEDVASLMRPRAIAKGLELHSEVRYPMPRTVHCDPLRMRQVIMNLLGNAIKFTEHGAIRMAVSYTEGRLRVEISDTGIGMSPGQIERLFRPFSQADETMARRFGGTGLGLAISHRLIGLMGGSVEVRSEAGLGTTFWFEVPVSAVSSGIIEHRPSIAHMPAAVRAAASAPLRGLRILLAEDGLDNQRLISFHLRKAGATVDLAENGLQAVDRLRSPSADRPLPDLVLMDMQMPEMDGYEATRALRRAGVALPIVALTAHAMAGDRALCLEAGCVDYLTKPIDREALVSAVARHCRPDRAAA